MKKIYVILTMAGLLWQPTYAQLPTDGLVARATLDISHNNYTDGYNTDGTNVLRFGNANGGQPSTTNYVTDRHGIKRGAINCQSNTNASGFRQSNLPSFMPKKDEPRTLSIWFKTEEIGNYSFGLMGYGHYLQDSLYAVEMENGRLVLESKEHRYKTPLLNGYTASTWHHVAVTYSNRQSTVYFNNVIVHDTTFVTGYNTPVTNLGGSRIYLGQQHLNPHTLDVVLDEFMVYNRALNTAEIEKLYRYKVNNRCVYLNPGPLNAERLVFSRDKVRTQTLPELSIEFKIRAYNRGSGNQFPAIVYGRTNQGGIGVNFSGDKLAYTWGGAHYNWTGGPELTMNDGKWHDVALVVTPDSAIIYFDGVPYVNKVTHPILDFHPEQWTVGYDNFSPSQRYTTADFDNLRIWEKSLTSEEVQNYIKCAPTANEPMLIHYFDFEEIEIFQIFGEVQHYVNRASLGSSLGVQSGGSVLPENQLTNDTETNLVRKPPLVSLPTISYDEVSKALLINDENVSGIDAINWYSTASNASLLIGEAFFPTANGTYYALIDSASCTFRTANLEVTVITGLFDDYELSYTIWPNPVKDLLRIDTEVAIEQINILDLQGKMVQSLQIASDNYVGHLMSGMYFVELISVEKKINTIKIIKE